MRWWVWGSGSDALGRCGILVRMCGRRFLCHNVFGRCNGRLPNAVECLCKCVANTDCGEVKVLREKCLEVEILIEKFSGVSSVV